MKTVVFNQNVTDKDTMEFYPEGSERSFPNERAQELIDFGCAKEVVAAKVKTTTVARKAATASEKKSLTEVKQTPNVPENKAEKNFN